MKKIIVIDDHPVIVVAIRVCLEKTGDLSVVDVADSGPEGLEKVRTHQPDLVILDLFLPKTDGLGMIRRIKAVSDKIKVLVLTGHEEGLYAAKSAQEGANGFVTKSKDMDEIVNTTRAILAGYNCFPSEDTLVAQARNPYGSKAGAELTSLTVRELAIMRYIAKGYSNKEIATMFFISQKTVSTYKARVLGKLKLKNSIAIAEYAREMGVI
ncbi:response regulator transcription factor [Paludibacterium yongneupense]|uniref:response regulator transcription factor n=1 Tax=Paludibacterium yongneupense TaxID=400061 RepID=UPI00041F0BD3|nr:response regulator transcription factor [Paludibacterium yongneupense]